MAILLGDVGEDAARALAYDIRDVDDGPAWRINRHWGLRRPSLRPRVRLERNPASV